MKIILLGPPGTGKGTQAERLSKDLNIPHISTGAIFREKAKEDSELGKQAKESITTGKLMPDELTVQIVKERINEKDCQNGFLLDGFPRTLKQAELLEKVTDIDYVIEIQSSDEIIIKRLTSRRTCKVCGKIYGIDVPPETEGKCKCGGDLFQRADDNEETIRNRLKIYEEQTKPLIDFYSNKGLLKLVDGEQSIDKIKQDIIETIKKKV